MSEQGEMTTAKGELVRRAIQRLETRQAQHAIAKEIYDTLCSEADTSLRSADEKRPEGSGG